jgi:hypothetical protein
VRIVRPTPQPSRFCAPKSATCRTILRPEKRYLPHDLGKRHVGR